MPKIDQLVDAMYGHPRMNFLDCPGTRGLRKDSIHLPRCKLPLYRDTFGLKNAGATYLRMMTRMFQDKIGRTVEVYINDMVVKSKQKGRYFGNTSCALMLRSALSV